jgi:iron complex transport system substrate-binding protein
LLRLPVLLQLRFLHAAWGCGMLAFALSAAAIEIRDDRGVMVRLAAPAQRIVTLSPHLAEIVFAAGAGSRLAGVVRFSDHPRAVRGLPLVGDAAGVDFERIVELRPDLVLAWRSGNSQRDVARLEQLGFAVYVTEPARLTDIPRMLRAVGSLAGTATVADQEAEIFINKINKLRGKYASRQAVRVFYQIWHRPRLTVNGAHLISDVISLCGGHNVFAQAPALTPEVSIEAVLAARPEVVLGGGSAGSEELFLAQWRTVPSPQLRALPAFYIAADSIQRQTPRIADGAAAVCRHLDGVRVRRLQEN